MFSKPADLTRIMNEHFVGKIEKHVSSLDPPQGTPIEPIRKMMRGKTCSLELKPVHPDQVKQIIVNMKASSSCGLDSIDMRIIKLRLEQMLPVITHIINLSISTETFP